MFVRHLTLKDFRSWPELDLELGPGVTVFTGANGFGKTNIVESIYYLANLSSHRVKHDAPLVRAGTDAAQLAATVVSGGRELVVRMTVKPHAANLAQLNRTRLRHPRELLGGVRCVLFSPEDLHLVTGEPEGRRRLIDSVISQETPRFSATKAEYERVLKQRNALLKQAKANFYPSMHGMLDVWDSQLASLGAELVTARSALITRLHPLVEAAYLEIAPHSRPPAISYLTRDQGETTAETEALLLTSLAEIRPREIDAGRTLIGPHKDDLGLYLGEAPAKGFASHGETWSFAIALKIAVFRLFSTGGHIPILILDDVFAELDNPRRQALTSMIRSAEQVLITTAVPTDIPTDLTHTDHTVLLKDGDSFLDVSDDE